MKKKIAIIALMIMLFGLALAGGFCIGKYHAALTGKSEVGLEVPKSLEDKIVIVYGYANYAWGYQHSGKVVMGDGSIYTFELSLDFEANTNDFNTLSKSEKFYDLLEKTDEKISQEDMEKLYGYLVDFDDDYTKQKMVANDAGQYYLDFVNYDEEKVYLIRTTGDVEYENDNDNVDKVVNILKKYGLSVRSLR